MKLNLGCGNRRCEGFVNVDIFGNPDVTHDLEQFPWPWPSDSVDEIRMIHVLEHLGQDKATFRRIMQELYRVCCNRAIIHIAVPHPRHDTFISDPTHVRAITEETISLLSREQNLENIRCGAPNSTLAIEWGVDFALEDIVYHFDARWQEKLKTGEIDAEQLYEAAWSSYNVIKSLELSIRVIKQ